MGNIIFIIGVAILLAPKVFAIVPIPSADIVGSFIIWLGVLLIALKK